MSSSKNNDYSVEKIISKRTDSKGRIFYLIKWEGYSSADNSWEPENHVTKCPDMIQAFEAEEAKKNKSNASQGRSSSRTTRSSLASPKKSTNNNERASRSSNRTSSTRQHHKRSSSNDSIFTEDDDNNGYPEKKSKRSRKSTTDTETTPSIESQDTEILDTTKLDRIVDVRRNKKTNTVEYHIQVKKVKGPVWIKSDRLTEDYTQEVVDFLEEKYV